jgi:hypothetical protein
VRRVRVGVGTWIEECMIGVLEHDLMLVQCLIWKQTDHPMSVVMLWIAVDVPTSRVDGISLNTELKQAAELWLCTTSASTAKGLRSLSSM